MGALRSFLVLGKTKKTRIVQIQPIIAVSLPLVRVPHKQQTQVCMGHGVEQPGGSQPLMLFPGSSHSSLQTLGKPLSLDPRTWHQMSLADPCCSMSPALALSLPGDRAFERSLSQSPHRQNRRETDWRDGQEGGGGEGCGCRATGS